MKRRTIITSVLVIVLCLGLISGSTFALFTSESSVNIAVTSGKVNVVATLKDLAVYSATADTVGLTDAEKADVAGTILPEDAQGAFAGTYYYKVMPVVNNTNTKGTFANGGTATLTNTKTLEIDRITPGDKVKVTVNVENQSNVITKYRVRVNVLDGETLEDQAKSLKLFEGLTVKVGTEELKGVIRVSNWTTLPAREPNSDDNLADIPVEIFLPLKAGNEYQDLKTEIQITVEAVQSNAATNTELELINAFLATQTPTTMNAAIKSLVNNTSIGLTTTLADYAAAFAKVQDYLWNVDTNQFYAESDATDFAYKYFKVYDAMPTVQTYSIYAAGSAWTVIEEVAGLTVGFDAGETTGITSVTYNRSTAEYGQDVVIRTNSAGTTLTVNAPKDVVKHYGDIGTLNIIAAANASYHEFGKVAFAEISKGRMTIEEGAQVTNLHINSIKENNVTTNKFDSIIISIAENATKPTFRRDDVEIAQNGTLVVAIQNGTEELTEETPLDYVWLTKQGIFEQIKVSDNSESIQNAKWADDDDFEDTNTQEAAVDIANNIGRDNDDNIKVEVEITKQDETKTYKVVLDENRDLVVVDKTDTTETPLATLDDKTSTVQVGTTEFTVALTSSQDNKEAELTVTNTADTTEVHKADAVSNSGLTEEKKAEVKTEVVDNAIIEEISNDDQYTARIGTKAYETLSAAIEASTNGDTIVLVGDVSENEPIKINKNLTIDLSEYTITAAKNKAALTLYSLDNVTVKNGTINGQIRIGEHQYTIVKYKTDGSTMHYYHPLKPAENVVLKDLTIDSGNKVALYYTNIEDDLIRADHSNPIDRDLYGHYIYKTGYTSQAQYEAHNRSEVFDVYEKKDKVTIINCSIESTVSLTGNMSSENGVLYSDVLDVQSGTFNNDTLGRFVHTGKYLVGVNSNEFEVRDIAPSNYTAKINSVYYTYEGGGNDAVKFANFGETVYLKETANQEKEFGMNGVLTIVYEQDGIEYTGAIPADKYSIGTRISESVENGIEFYSYFHAVAAVYRTTNNSQNPSLTQDNLVGTYATVAEAFVAANKNGQFSYVRLIDNYEGGDDARYYYTDSARYAGAHNGSSVRFDLNGYTWTYTGTNYALVITTQSGSSNKATYIVDTSAGKTGQILAPNGTCIYKQNSGGENTFITGGTFIAKNRAVNINKLSVSGKTGRWYITGGTFQSTNGAAINLGSTHSSGLLEISGGTFISGGTAKTITSGGGPVHLNGGTYNTNPNTYVSYIEIPLGKSAVDNGDGTWTIK